jgi:hypothetical protein
LKRATRCTNGGEAAAMGAAGRQLIAERTWKHYHRRIVALHRRCLTGDLQKARSVDECRPAPVPDGVGSRYEHRPAILARYAGRRCCYGRLRLHGHAHARRLASYGAAVSRSAGVAAVAPRGGGDHRRRCDESLVTA